MAKSKKNYHYGIKIPCLFLLAAFVTILSCGNQDRTEMASPLGSKGSIVFSLNFEQVPSANDGRSAPGDDICEAFGIDTITAAVADSNDDEIASGSWPCDEHAGTLSNIPANRGLLVLIVEALVSGEKVWRGEVHSVEIIPGQNSARITALLHSILPFSCVDSLQTSRKGGMTMRKRR